MEASSRILHKIPCILCQLSCAHNLSPIPFPSRSILLTIIVKWGDYLLFSHFYNRHQYRTLPALKSGHWGKGGTSLETRQITFKFHFTFIKIDLLICGISGLPIPHSIWTLMVIFSKVPSRCLKSLWYEWKFYPETWKLGVFSRPIVLIYWCKMLLV